MQRRLAREYAALQKSDEFDDQVRLEMVGHDLSEQTLRIRPKHSPWTGAELRFRMSVPRSYPQKPPSFTPVGRYPHPNLSDVRVCVSTLADDWAPGMGLSGAIMAVMWLIYNPNFSDPLTGISPETYDKVVPKAIRGQRFRDPHVFVSFTPCVATGDWPPLPSSKKAASAAERKKESKEAEESEVETLMAELDEKEAAEAAYLSTVSPIALDSIVAEKDAIMEAMGAAMAMLADVEDRFATLEQRSEALLAESKRKTKKKRATAKRWVKRRGTWVKEEEEEEEEGVVEESMGGGAAVVVAAAAPVE